MAFPVISEAVEGIFKGVVKPLLDKWVPDAKDRLEAEQFFFKQAHEVNMAQIEVNKIEAQSSSLFVAGWRPLIGWVCGASFAYAVIGNDLANWSLQVAHQFTGKLVPVLPEPDVTLTFEILMAMLGLGGLRTYEKTKGIAK